MFDEHETEDCPVQSGCMDLDPPPNTKSKKDRKLPPPRKYCDNCEGKKDASSYETLIQEVFSTVFDSHETDECPGADETY